MAINLHTYEHTQFDKLLSQLLARDLYIVDRPVDIDDEEKIRDMLSCAFLNGVAFGRKITKEESEELLRKYGFEFDIKPKVR